MIPAEKIQQNVNFSFVQTRKFHLQVPKYFYCTGDPKRVSHSSNVSDSVTCMCL